MPHISASAQLTLNNPANFLIFALYDSTAPTVLLDQHAPAKPYGDPIQVTFNFNCLSGHIYDVAIWENNSPVVGGVQRNRFALSVYENGILAREPLYLESQSLMDTDGYLITGETTYNNATLFGWVFDVERVGSGTFIPDYATLPVTDITTTQTSFTLIDGSVFQEGEKYVIRFTPKNTINTAGAPSPIFSTGRIITADETLSATDQGGLLLLQSATSKLTVTLPALSAVSDFAPFYFRSNGGQHINAVLLAAGSDMLLYNTQRQQVVLGQVEDATIYKAFGVWVVDNDIAGLRSVGEFIYNYGRNELNTILCNGQIINRADYPRLWAYVQLLSSGVVSDAAWAANTQIKDGITYYLAKPSFSTGDGNTTFRLPLLTNMMFKSVDGMSRGVGSLEIEQGIDHIHNTGMNGETGGSAGGNGDHNGGTVTVGSNHVHNTEKPAGTSGVALTRFGAKNLVDNIGAYCLIRC